MAVIEEAFPRGGRVKETKPTAVSKTKKLKKPDNLFKVT